MKRSEINGLLRAAEACFHKKHWALPPQPRWDVTDFGLGDWRRHGLVLVNLASEAEYCEKLMYARAGMPTPCHCHHRKKEDIICRWGELLVRAWPTLPPIVKAVRSRCPSTARPGRPPRGSRSASRPESGSPCRRASITSSFPKSRECILGEVSTANDDLKDNFFLLNSNVGRFPRVVEDEPPAFRLVSDAV